MGLRVVVRSQLLVIHCCATDARLPMCKAHAIKDAPHSSRSQVISVCKSADLLLMVLDATKPWGHKEILTRELESVGIRLNRCERGLCVIASAQPFLLVVCFSVFLVSAPDCPLKQCYSRLGLQTTPQCDVQKTQGRWRVHELHRAPHAFR